MIPMLNTVVSITLENVFFVIVFSFTLTTKLCGNVFEIHKNLELISDFTAHNLI